MRNYRLSSFSFTSFRVNPSRFLLPSGTFPSLSSSLTFSSRFFSTFVSKHYTLSSNDLKEALDSMETRYRSSSSGYEVQVCNFCEKGNKNKESNMWKLKVNLDGSYHCYRCSIHGTYFDLKKKIGNCQSDNFSSSSSSSTFSSTSLLSSNSTIKDDLNDTQEVKKYKIPDQEVMLSHARQILVKTDPDAITAMKYLTETRKISKPIILKYFLPFFLSFSLSIICK